MFRDLMLIVPLGFAASLSPMMLTEQTVLLAGRNGRRTASRFALGTVLVAAVYLTALVAWGHAISLPKRPTLNASMDIVAGVILVLLAIAIRLHPSGARKQAVRTGMDPKAAFGFGVFSMATNFTSLALLLPAAKDVAAGVSNMVGRIALVAILIGFATMPAWLPIAMTRVAPGPAERALDWLSNVIAQNGRSIAGILIAVLGLVLVGRGALHVLT